MGSLAQNRKIRFLTNIPTPYRNHHFQSLYRHLQTRAEFEVWFTSKSERNRNWDCADGLTFPHRFFGHDTTVVSQLRAASELWHHIKKDRPDVLIIGGYFNLPLALACILKRWWATKGILYCETHTTFTRGTARRLLRRALIRGFDTFIVPGPLQKRYITGEFGGDQRVTIHQMPNLVSERVFASPVSNAGARDDIRAKLGIPSTDLVFFCAARLEPIKAIDILLESASQLPPQTRLLIAGTGSLKKSVANSEAVRSGRAELLGYCDETTVRDLLTASDVFVLPSRNDPFPLSVIEALWMRLPLILSDAVGCHPVALKPGVNGLLCKAGSTKDLTNALCTIASMRGNLRKMGDASRAIAEAEFSTEYVAEDAAEFLTHTLHL